jgi:hypothetical protein
MDKAVRHQDGRMITSSEWSAIKATARMIKPNLLCLPLHKARRGKNQPRTKTYFRTWYPREWKAALEEMEAQQPLLALCAAHWKADHILGSTLLVSTRTDPDDDSEINSDQEIAGKKHKLSEPPPQKIKKKKHKTDTASTRGDASSHPGTSSAAVFDSSDFFQKIHQHQWAIRR